MSCMFLKESEIFALNLKTNFLLKSLNDSNTFENDSNPFENNLNYFLKKKLILGGEKKELRKLKKFRTKDLKVGIFYS